MASYIGDAQFLREKQPKAKIRQCSRMGNFCPHAAASPKSVREYEYIVYSCTIGDVGGARSTCIFGRAARLRGFVFLLKQAGSVPKEKKMSAMARPHI
jgi:hypothetical protein